jgi:2-C-methyl-D-erythritol 2,4-cyclodiphosphate synthase
MNTRVGIGYDIHRLVENRKLILGGESIDFHLGLQGHSDADVLTHAICDALLGAAGLGDIGRHFPDNDPIFKDIFSQELLRRVVKMLHQKGFRVVNVDATIITEAPKLAPYMDKIAQNLAGTMSISVDRVNIKAKTHEKMDAIGQGQAIAVQAVALIETVQGRDIG